MFMNELEVRLLKWLQRQLRDKQRVVVTDYQLTDAAIELALLIDQEQLIPGKKPVNTPGPLGAGVDRIVPESKNQKVPQLVASVRVAVKMLDGIDADGELAKVLSLANRVRELLVLELKQLGDS